MFEIPITLQVDTAALKQQFYILSRKFHPDFYTQENEAEQNQALDKSSLLNKAYKTFQNREETIKYVLQLKGLQEEEEKYQLSPTFLMEMMELNENLAEAKLSGNISAIDECKQTINSIEEQIYMPVKNIVEGYIDGKTTQEELLKVKEYYFKKKYLQRILDTTLWSLNIAAQFERT